MEYSLNDTIVHSDKKKENILVIYTFTSSDLIFKRFYAKTLSQKSWSDGTILLFDISRQFSINCKDSMLKSFIHFQMFDDFLKSTGNGNVIDLTRCSAFTSAGNSDLRWIESSQIRIMSIAMTLFSSSLSRLVISI